MDDWNGFSVTRLMPFVSQQDLEDTYNLSFKSCVVNGIVASVMCSYDKVNDIPTCVDENLLAGTRKMELERVHCLDCDSVFYKQQHH